ncbi:MAG: CheY-like chemotaxis protein [Ascidiaceihabitans sp.]|jgi:CheY-like chemotaxis protein
MTHATNDGTFSDALAAELPYLRRYTRALTGSQASGDKYTVATLEAILSDRTPFENDDGVRVNLFKCFHAIWSTSGRKFEQDQDGATGQAHRHLATLTANSREALLLSTIEDFSLSNVGKIMDMSAQDASTLVDQASADLAKTAQGRIMIIEDEPIIAMDLQMICEGLGHTVTGIARTRDEAVKLGTSDAPSLILADIQLADNSSGIDAVNDLLADIDVPVIFITAFPERLLTGDRPEPAFLISKPFRRDQVKSAVSQAMFFGSTETLLS